MKNKHLLLLFTCTLLLGLLAKYSPWFKNDIFHSDLIHIDSSKIERISITVPGKTELLLEHSEEGWVASQDDFAVRTADSLVSPILACLAGIQSKRIVQGAQRDTLQLLAEQSVHVEVFMKNGGKERFEIGREIWEGREAATYIEIDRHDGIYLTDKHLRQVFEKQIDAFRSKVVLEFFPDKLQTLQVLRQNADTLYFQKSDTADTWQSGALPKALLTEQVQTWLLNLQQLAALPFATPTEERHAADNWVATLALGIKDLEEPITLQFFSVEGQQRPSLQRKSLAYLLQSSQNPFAFFVLTDTTLVQKILSGPLTVND